MRETWYVMEDGSAGDPREIAPGKNGKLVHRDGRAVAYGPYGPRSRGVDADAERKTAKPPAKPSEAKPATGAKPKPDAATSRDMKPELPSGGYKTRDGKAH